MTYSFNGLAGMYAEQGRLDLEALYLARPGWTPALRDRTLMPQDELSMDCCAEVHARAAEMFDKHGVVKLCRVDMDVLKQYVKDICEDVTRVWESQGRNMRYCYEYQSIYHAASYLRAYAELVWRRGRASNDAMRKTVMQVGRDMYFSEESLVANYPAIIAALPVAEGISAQDISETLKSVMRDVGET